MIRFHAHCAQPRINNLDEVDSRGTELVYELVKAHRPIGYQITLRRGGPSYSLRIHDYKKHARKIVVEAARGTSALALAAAFAALEATRTAD